MYKYQVNHYQYSPLRNISNVLESIRTVTQEFYKSNSNLTTDSAMQMTRHLLGKTNVFVLFFGTKTVVLAIIEVVTLLFVYVSFAIVLLINLFAIHNLLQRVGIIETVSSVNNNVDDSVTLATRMWISNVVSAGNFLQEQAMKLLYLGNHYGLFATMTKERNEIIIEVSNNKIDWYMILFNYKPDLLLLPPKAVVPMFHMPRLDWVMWFLAFKKNKDLYPRYFWVFLIGILQGNREILSLLHPSQEELTSIYAQSDFYFRASNTSNNYNNSNSNNNLSHNSGDNSINKVQSTDENRFESKDNEVNTEQQKKIDRIKRLQEKLDKVESDILGYSNKADATSAETSPVFGSNENSDLDSSENTGRKFNYIRVSLFNYEFNYGSSAAPDDSGSSSDSGSSDTSCTSSKKESQYNFDSENVSIATSTSEYEADSVSQDGSNDEDSTESRQASDAPKLSTSSLASFSRLFASHDPSRRDIKNSCSCTDNWRATYTKEMIGPSTASDLYKEIEEIERAQKRWQQKSTAVRRQNKESNPQTAPVSIDEKTARDIIIRNLFERLRK